MIERDRRTKYNGDTPASAFSDADLRAWHSFVESGLMLACVWKPNIPNMPPDQTASTSSTSNAVVRFRVGTTWYSVPCSIVQSVQPLGHYLPIPFLHPCVIGAINVQNHQNHNHTSHASHTSHTSHANHHQFAVILDIQPLLPGSRTLPHPDKNIVVIQLDSILAGLIADEVVSLAPAQD